MANTHDHHTTILAVDDMPANLIALEAVLASDYHLLQAQSGQEALDLLTQHPEVDLILMDLQMPGMDGFEAASRIKQREECRDIPIIFITAVYKEDPFVRKGYEAGAVDYFSKPFDPDILKMKINIYSSFRKRQSVLKEREARLVESEELLKAGRKLTAILESLQVGVLIADRDGRICQTNEVVGRILNTEGVDEAGAYGEMLGWWSRDGQLIKNHQGPLDRALHEGISTHNELIPVRSVDGTEKTLVGSASPLRATDGHIVGAVIVIQDVTEQKKIELDLESRLARLIAIGVELEHDFH